MKQLLGILMVCSVGPMSAQNIFKHEQKIELSEGYERQEIIFTNSEDSIALSGTLICPSKCFEKLVIIVPGSGKDTRHSHFDLAKEFLLNQIAVFRFDQRGLGKSQGQYRRNNETATILEKDVICAFKHLKSSKDLSNKKIGILGHSLGGIASIGALGQGCDLDFLIQMATPVENNGAFLKYQVLTNPSGFFRVKGKTPAEVSHFIDVLRKSVNPDESYKTTRKKAKTIRKQLNFRNGRHIINKVIIDLMKQNPEEIYKSSNIPILFIIGSDDRAISCKDEMQTLQRLNNPNITISLINDVDHYLNDKKNPNEQFISPYRMSDKALKEILDWTLEK